MTKNQPVCAFVFKTVADPFVGRISYLKVVSGVLKPEMTLLNTMSEKPEKDFTNLYDKRQKTDSCI